MGVYSEESPAFRFSDATSWGRHHFSHILCFNASLSSGDMRENFSCALLFQECGPLWPPLPSPPNNIFDNSNRPNACQKVMTGPRKRSGTSQFHSCWVRKVSNASTKRPNKTHKKILPPLFMTYILS